LQAADELERELEVLKFADAKQPVKHMKALLADLNSPMPEGTQDECYEQIKKLYIEYRNLKSAVNSKSLFCMCFLC